MNYFFSKLFSLTILITILAACGSKQAEVPAANSVSALKPAPTPSIALQVNGIPISKETVETQRVVWQTEASSGQPDPKTDALVFETLINRTLMQATAEKLGIKQDTLAAEKIKLLEQATSPEAMENWLAKNHMSAAAFEQFVGAEMQAQAVFNAITATVPTTAAQIHARCLHFSDENTAQTAQQQLIDSASFVTLATSYACTDEAKQFGADLGWFPAGVGVLPPEIEQVAFTMQPGSTSDVLSAKDGFFILKVDARADNRPLTPEYHYQLRVNTFQNWLTQQYASAKIERIAN